MMFQQDIFCYRYKCWHWQSEISFVIHGKPEKSDVKTFVPLMRDMSRTVWLLLIKLLILSQTATFSKAIRKYLKIHKIIKNVALHAGTYLSDISWYVQRICMGGVWVCVCVYVCMWWGGWVYELQWVVAAK